MGIPNWFIRTECTNPSTRARFLIPLDSCQYQCRCGEKNELLTAFYSMNYDLNMIWCYFLRPFYACGHSMCVCATFLAFEKKCIPILLLHLARCKSRSFNVFIHLSRSNNIEESLSKEEGEERKTTHIGVSSELYHLDDMTIIINWTKCGLWFRIYFLQNV